MTAKGPLFWIAGWCAYISGVVCILGIVFLVLLYTLGTGSIFGPLNDIAVVIQYTLALPIVVALHQLLRPYGSGLSLAAVLIGLAAMLAVIVLQILLVAGVTSFGQQVGWVIGAFMFIVAWFVIVERLGRSTDETPNGVPLHVFAGLYFAYPIWAFSLGRRLLRR